MRTGIQLKTRSRVAGTVLCHSLPKFSTMAAHRMAINGVASHFKFILVVFNLHEFRIPGQVLRPHQSSVRCVVSSGQICAIRLHGTSYATNRHDTGSRSESSATSALEMTRRSLVWRRHASVVPNVAIHGHNTLFAKLASVRTFVAIAAISMAEMCVCSDFFEGPANHRIVLQVHLCHPRVVEIHVQPSSARRLPSSPQPRRAGHPRALRVHRPVRQLAGRVAVASSGINSAARGVGSKSFYC
jgi:hypothetical protein